MQELAIFKNEEFGFGVRVVDVGGTSWFVDNGKTIYHRRITQLGREMIINLLSSVEG